MNDPRKDERLSWLSWLIFSGRFTNIVVTRHAAEGRAQDRVSSPSKDRRSANCATQPNQYTRNSSGDEIANVNFLYDDIVHVLQNTIDSCIPPQIDAAVMCGTHVYQIQ